MNDLSEGIDSEYIKCKDVNKETFEYVMKTAIEQCDLYIQGKEEGNIKLQRAYQVALYLCDSIVLIMICIFLLIFY